MNGLSKSLGRLVNASVLHASDALNLPTVPLASVVGLAHDCQSILLTEHRRGVQTVRAFQLDRHHHAVPLAALLQLCGLHHDQCWVGHAILIDDHDVMVRRVVDIITVIQEVF